MEKAGGDASIKIGPVNRTERNNQGNDLRQPDSNPGTQDRRAAGRRPRASTALAAAGVTLLLLLLLVSLPYLLAAGWDGETHVFGGFLLNPLDGNSYLAKMQQGWQGEWRFTLLYSSEGGEGAFLYLLYLGLGHLARFAGLSLPLTFHLARLAASLVMLLALYRFMQRVLGSGFLPAFVLAALGSGLGWIALLSGAFTSDFWVAEIYPFLSAYANPHFPLGLALMLALLTPAPDGSLVEAEARRAGLPGSLLSFGLAFILGLVQPFGVVIVSAVLAGTAVWQSMAYSRASGSGWIVMFRRAVTDLFHPRGRFLWAALGGGVVLLYSLAAILLDPQLSAWNRQNLTPSPPLWDLLVSLSPALLLAPAGLWSLRKRLSPAGRMLLVWAVLGALFLYLPLGLQRRFLTGLHVPLAALAGCGLSAALGAAGRWKRSASLLWALALLFSLPTNAVVLLAGVQGARERDPALYLTQGEFSALAWLEQNTDPQALVLASPEMGLFVPAHSGRRVLYGHPFESVNASQEEAAVRAVFQPGASGEMRRLVEQRGVDYVFYGDRERLLGALDPQPWLQEVYRAGEVVLYAVPGR